MGGYGVYVWGSVGVSAALWALEVWFCRIGRLNALDVVCEAMDADDHDASPTDDLAASSIGTPRPIHFSRGAAT